MKKLKQIGFIRTVRQWKNNTEIPSRILLNRALLTRYAGDKLGKFLPSLPSLLTLCMHFFLFQNTYPESNITLIMNIYTNTYQRSVTHRPLVPLLLKSNLQELQPIPPGASDTEFLSDCLLSSLQLEEINHKRTNMDLEKVEQLLLSRKLSIQQKEELLSFPEIAVEYAVSQLRHKNQTGSYRYFVGIVRSFLSKRSFKKEEVPNVKPSASIDHPYKPYEHNEESADERTTRRIQAGHRAFLFESKREYGSTIYNPEWSILCASQKSELFRLFPYIREVHHRDYHYLGEGLVNPSLPSVQEPL